MKTYEVADPAALETPDARGLRLTLGHVLLGLAAVSIMGWLVLAAVVRALMQLFG
jgi:hypothetical protein